MVLLFRYFFNFDLTKPLNGRMIDYFSIFSILVSVFGRPRNEDHLPSYFILSPSERKQGNYKTSLSLPISAKITFKVKQLASEGLSETLKVI